MALPSMLKQINFGSYNNKGIRGRKWFQADWEGSNEVQVEKVSTDLILITPVDILDPLNVSTLLSP
jgi:hypothetical protein